MGHADTKTAELVRLAGHCDTLGAMHEALTAYKEAERQAKAQTLHAEDPEWIRMLALTRLYWGGVINGKREERARRRRTGNTPNAQK